MSDETTLTCVRCGHAYTERYGREVEVHGGIDWVCHDCLGVSTLELIANYERIARVNRPDWDAFIEEAAANPMATCWEILEAGGFDDWGTDLWGAVRAWIDTLKRSR